MENIKEYVLKIFHMVMHLEKILKNIVQINGKIISIILLLYLIIFKILKKEMDLNQITKKY